MTILINEKNLRGRSDRPAGIRLSFRTPTAVLNSIRINEPGRALYGGFAMPPRDAIRFEE
jgi:hypothetical protein